MVYRRISIKVDKCKVDFRQMFSISGNLAWRFKVDNQAAPLRELDDLRNLG